MADELKESLNKLRSKINDSTLLTGEQKLTFFTTLKRVSRASELSALDARVDAAIAAATSAESPAVQPETSAQPARAARAKARHVSPTDYERTRSRSGKGRAASGPVVVSGGPALRISRSVRPAASARPSGGYAGEEVVASAAVDPVAFLASRLVFADEGTKTNKRRPFTRREWLLLNNILGSALDLSNLMHDTTFVTRAETALRNYGDYYTTEKRVSETEREMMTLAVDQFGQEISDYLSRAAPEVARYVDENVPDAPRRKTDPFSRAIISEDDPRFIAAAAAEKARPKPVSPYALQAKPLPRAKRRDILRSVMEKGRLSLIYRGKNSKGDPSLTPERYAVVLVRSVPYQFAPPRTRGRSASREASPETTHAKFVRQTKDHIAETVKDVARWPKPTSLQFQFVLLNITRKAVYALVDELVDYSNKFQQSLAGGQAMTPEAIATVEALNQRLKQVVRVMNRMGTESDTLAMRCQRAERDLKNLEAALVDDPKNAFTQRNRDIAASFIAASTDNLKKWQDDAETIFVSLERTSESRFEDPSKKRKKRTTRTEADDDDDEIIDLAPHVPFWLLDAVLRRYIFLYPLSLPDARDLIFKEREIYAEAFSKYFKRTVLPDVTASGHFIIDVDKLFRVQRYEPADLWVNTSDLIDTAFMVPVPNAGFQYIGAARAHYEARAEQLQESELAEQAARKRDAQMREANDLAESADANNLERNAHYIARVLLLNHGPEVFIRDGWASEEMRIFDKIYRARLADTNQNDPIRAELIGLAAATVESRPVDRAANELIFATLSLLDAVSTRLNAQFFPPKPKKGAASGGKRGKRGKAAPVSAEDMMDAALRALQGVRENTDEDTPEDTPDAAYTVDEGTMNAPPYDPENDTVPLQSAEAAGAAQAWPVSTDEPDEPKRRLTWPTPIFIRDWLNTCHNFFGVIVDYSKKYFDAEDSEIKHAFDVFGPHNIVTVAKYYRQHQLMPSARIHEENFFGPMDTAASALFADEVEAAAEEARRSYDDYAQTAGQSVEDREDAREEYETALEEFKDALVDAGYDESYADSMTLKKYTRLMDDWSVPRAFIFRADYDNLTPDASSLQESMEQFFVTTLKRPDTEDEEAEPEYEDLREKIYARFGVEEGAVTEEQENYLDNLPYQYSISGVFRVQFVWPFTSEPLTLPVTTSVEEADDRDIRVSRSSGGGKSAGRGPAVLLRDIVGATLNEFLFRQFNTAYAAPDNVLAAIHEDLIARHDQLSGATDNGRLPTEMQESISGIYKLTGRIEALSNWSQQTYLNDLERWYENLRDTVNPPWWLTKFIEVLEFISAQPYANVPALAYTRRQAPIAVEQPSHGFKKGDRIVFSDPSWVLLSATLASTPMSALVGEKIGEVISTSFSAEDPPKGAQSDIFYYLPMRVVEVETTAAPIYDVVQARERFTADLLTYLREIITRRIGGQNVEQNMEFARNVDWPSVYNTVAAFWAEAAGRLSTKIAQAGRALGFTHVLTSGSTKMTTGGKLAGGRVITRLEQAAGAATPTAVYGRTMPLQELSAQDYERVGPDSSVAALVRTMNADELKREQDRIAAMLKKRQQREAAAATKTEGASEEVEMGARFEETEPKRTRVRRTVAESEEAGAAPVDTAEVAVARTKRQKVAPTMYRVFPSVLEYRAEIADRVKALTTAENKFLDLPALMRSLDDPDYLQPRWEVPADVKASAKRAAADKSQGNLFALNLNSRRIISAQIANLISQYFSTTSDGQNGLGSNSDINEILDSLTATDDLSARLVEIYRNEIAPRYAAIHGTNEQAALAAYEELLQMAESNPNNMAYIVALNNVFHVSLKYAPFETASTSTGGDDAAESESPPFTPDDEPRPNRGHRRGYERVLRGSRVPRVRQRRAFVQPVLTANEQERLNGLRQGPAMIIRQAVVTQMDKVGLLLSAETLKDAFRKAVATLERRGLLDTSAGRPQLTEKGRKAETALIAEMTKSRKLLQQIVVGYDKYVRVTVARTNGLRVLSAKFDEIARRVMPPKTLKRDNPSGFALSGEVLTRRMYDPRTQREEITPVVEYRPQVYKDEPTFVKGSKQNQNRVGNRGKPYRPRIYLPIDPDHPTTQAFFEDISRTTHANVRSSYDWSAKAHQPGQDTPVYAPEELIPMGRKWRGAGPRGAAVKGAPTITEAEREREAEKALNLRAKADADAAAALEKERKRIVSTYLRNRTLTDEDVESLRAIIEDAKDAFAANQPVSADEITALRRWDEEVAYIQELRVKTREGTRLKPAVKAKLDKLVRLHSTTAEAQPEVARVPGASAEPLPMSAEEKMRAENAALRAARGLPARPVEAFFAVSPEESGEYEAETTADVPVDDDGWSEDLMAATAGGYTLSLTPIAGTTSTRASKSRGSEPKKRQKFEAPELPEGSYDKDNYIKSNPVDMNIELGLAFTWRARGDADDTAGYQAAVEGERATYSTHRTSKRQTNAGRVELISALEEIAKSSKPDFNALSKLSVSPNTIRRLNEDPPADRKNAALDYIKLLKALVPRSNGARVGSRNNNHGSVQHGPRIQGFRVR